MLTQPTIDRRLAVASDLHAHLLSIADRLDPAVHRYNDDGCHTVAEFQDYLSELHQAFEQAITDLRNTGAG